LGRLLVVPYYPLSEAMLALIVRLQIKRIQRRLEENHGIVSEVDESVITQIVQRCTEVESGGRMVDAILTNTLLPQMSQLLLTPARATRSTDVYTSPLHRASFTVSLRRNAIIKRVFHYDGSRKQPDCTERTADGIPL
jgi:ATP-dependent Clp protease ATP-binding subunit ClpA